MIEELPEWADGLVELGQILGEPLPVPPEKQASIAANMQEQLDLAGPDANCHEPGCAGVVFDGTVTLYELPDEHWYLFVGNASCAHATATFTLVMERRTVPDCPPDE
jgi:hypothetical protein